jgi:hypothetical protein
MTITKVHDQNVTDLGSAVIPEEISPTMYIRSFFEWLQAKEQNVVHTVHLRLVLFHAESFDDNGVIAYGELGIDASDNTEATMKLGMTPQLKKFLKGTAKLYSSDERWFKPVSVGLSGSSVPFDPNTQSQVEVTIWTGSGQIDLNFAPKQANWKIEPKYAAGSNLLYGFPSGTGAPIVKPMIVLSLSKHAILM